MRLLFLLIFLATPLEAIKAHELVTDLSENMVSIQSDFSGTNILLFGAISNEHKAEENPHTHDNPHEIAVIIRGPSGPIVVRQKEHIAGIWANRGRVIFEDAPSFYALSSSVPLSEIADQQALLDYGLGAKYLALNAIADKGADITAYRLGWQRNKEQAGLYDYSERGVRIINNRLFRAEAALPSGVPVGSYQVEFLLFSDGKVIDRELSRIEVGIFGFGQLLHRWAYERSFLYGLAGVFLALVLGWAVSAAFIRI